MFDCEDFPEAQPPGSSTEAAATAVEEGVALDEAERTRDRRPEIDAADLLRCAKQAKVELKLACEVPVPSCDCDLDLEEAAEEGDEEAADAEIAAVATEHEDEEQVVAPSDAAVVPPEAVEAAAPAGPAFSCGDPPPPPAALAAPAEDASGGGSGSSIEEAVRGTWVSYKGECRIFEDHITSRLAYEELLNDGDGQRLHGWLVRKGSEAEGVLEASLSVLDEDEGVWYGPSFGEEPESVGDIQVRLLRKGLGPPELETRIRVEEEDSDWQPPVMFRLKEQEGGGPFVGGGAGISSSGPEPASDSAGVFVFGGAA